MKKDIQRVLIVEDNIFFQNIFQNSLKNKYQVKVVDDYSKAMLVLDDFKPQIIILDILLPADTGFCLLNDLSSYDDTAKIPVIICSSVADQLNSSVMKASGVVAILNKTTMRPTDLIKEIRKVDILNESKRKNSSN